MTQDRLPICHRENEGGHFEPSKFEDQYEDTLKELLKRKQEGKPIERPERPKPTKVVNLMDALRQSVEQAGRPPQAKRKLMRQPGAALTRKRSSRSGKRHAGLADLAVRKSALIRAIAPDLAP